MQRPAAAAAQCPSPAPAVFDVEAPGYSAAAVGSYSYLQSSLGVSATVSQELFQLYGQAASDSTGQIFTRIQSLFPRYSDAEEVQILHGAGTVAWLNGDIATAQQLWRDSTRAATNLDESEAREVLLPIISSLHRLGAGPVAAEFSRLLTGQASRDFDPAAYRAGLDETSVAAIYSDLGDLPRYDIALIAQESRLNAQQSDLARAAAQIEQALALLPRVTAESAQETATGQIIAAMIGAGQLEDALALAESLPESDYWMGQVAIALAESNQFQRALELATPLSRRGRDHTLSQLVEIQLDRKQPNCALQAALQVQYAVLDAHMPKLVGQLAAAGQTDYALSLLQSYIKDYAHLSDPATDHRTLMIQIAEVLIEQGDTELAVATLDVYEQPEKRLDYLSGLIQQLVEQGEQATAAALLPTAEALAVQTVTERRSTIPGLPPPPSSPPASPNTAKANIASGPAADGVDILDYYRQLQAALPLATVYHALDLDDEALSQLQTVLELPLLAAIAKDGDLSEQDLYRAVVHTQDVTDRYLALGYGDAAVEHLSAIQQTLPSLPSDRQAGTRQVLANSFANVGEAQTALALAEPDQLFEMAQKQLALSLARTGQVEQAIAIATTQDTASARTRRLVDIAIALALAGQDAPASDVLAMMLADWESATPSQSPNDPNRTNADDLSRAFLKHEQRQTLYRSQQQILQQIMEQGWYDGAFQLLEGIQVPPAALAPDPTDASFPLASWTEALLDLATVAVHQTAPDVAIAAVQQHPNPLERARALARLAQIFHEADQPALSVVAWQAAQDALQTLPKHRGQQWVTAELAAIAISLER